MQGLFGIGETKMLAEVIYGPIFAGKTEALLEIMERNQESSAYFRLTTDPLPSWNQEFITHSGQRFMGHKVPLLSIISTDAEVILLDEIQFARLDEIAQFLFKFANRRIYAAGLNLDFRQSPFLPTLEFVSIARALRYLTSRCIYCGQDAAYSAKIESEKPEEQLDEYGVYQPVCGDHWNAIQKPTCQSRSASSI